MTREEAYNHIDDIITRNELTKDELVTFITTPKYDALKIAREALKQEPCEDAVSRQAILNGFLTLDIELKPSAIDAILNLIEHLQPINPEPKIGHWIRVTDKTEHLVLECDKCGWQQRYNTNFCPDCGAKMIGLIVAPRESEE